MFEWNDKKATSNFIKHGVTFDEAKSVFYIEEYWKKIHHTPSDKMINNPVT